MKFRCSYNFIYSFAIFIIVIVECVISCSLLQMNILNEKNYNFSIPVFSINSILSIIFLFQWIEKNDKHIFVLLGGSYIIKLILLLREEFITNLVLTSDMAIYQRAAVLFYYFNTPILAGHWSNAALFMGSFYKIFGIQTLLLRHFNLTCILMSGLIIYKILKKINIHVKYITLVTIWIQFSPYLLGNSITIHQESMITFSISLSLYFFICWFLEGGRFQFILTILFALPAIMLHAGTYGIAVGYFIVMTLYSPEKKKFLFDNRTITTLVIFIFSFLVMYFTAFNIFFQKFSGRTIEGIIAGVEYAKGGSYYSVGGHISNIGEAILYTPLRMIYFFMSPMPWNWRGFRDMIGFFISGALYGFQLFLAFAEIRHKNMKNHTMVCALLFPLISFGFIFGWGVKNAGTAIRHRDKAISIAAVIMALCLDDFSTKRKRSKKFLIFQ